MDADLWLPRRRAESLTTRLRLLCFAHAGGGSAAFGPWLAALPAGVGLCPVRLPGREDASHQPPLDDVHIIAHQASEALASLAIRPSVLLGHSLGAVIAYEVARLLEARGLGPRLLIVSGREGPQTPSSRAPIAELPDQRFIAELDARYGGIPAELERSAELLARFLPCLRADLAASERYRHRGGQALRCPIAVCQGRHDHSIDRSQLAGWNAVTSGETEHHWFTGGHFFSFEAGSGFLPWLDQRLRRVLAGHS